MAWCTEVAATHCSLDYLSSTHEEADTKLILHALDANVRWATKLFIFAQDTDILILAVRRYDRLPNKSFFVPDQHTLISLHDIASTLGPLKTAALPGFHALSGCDSTGCLVGKGKSSYWKAFTSAGDKTLAALASLGSTDVVPDEITEELEAFICQVYQPGTKLRTLSALRWWMFSTKQVVGEKLPPTKGTFLPAIRRVNFQAIVWAHDDKSTPILPSPADHGWTMEEGHLDPVMCELPCAPSDIMKLVKCSCVKSRCTATCKCRSNGLPCTEMCGCAGDEALCDNIYASEDDGDEVSDAEDDIHS